MSAPARAVHLALKESRYAATCDRDSDRELVRALAPVVFLGVWLGLRHVERRLRH